MTRKIIIDCDAGIDDAVAICTALFDPRLEVAAITATAGTVVASQATANVTAIVGQLDPPRYPRIGKATPTDDDLGVDQSQLYGSDGLGDCDFPPVDRQHQLPSEKVIADLVHQYPNQITLVCLGPLTNLARLCRRDPAAVGLIDKVIISGGSVACPGNVTAGAERNMYFDPSSAAEAFTSATTKSLIPLDVSEQVRFGVELLDQLPSKKTAAGELLHEILPFAFRTAHQILGRELIPLYDATAILAVVEPECFTWKDMAGKVETSGALTRGMTLFDQRLRRQWQLNMEVAATVDHRQAVDAIVRALRYAGQNS